MSKLTIRDIAKMAGVSTTTVSLVLNNREGVSDATRQRIQDIISYTNFTPNVHTRRLNLGKSFTFHVVLHWYESALFDQFALEILHGIFKASKELGYSIIFTFVDNAMDNKYVMDSIRSKDCDGVILCQVDNIPFIMQLHQEHIPFICVDSHIAQDAAIPQVDIDYYTAAYKATSYLYQCGHKDIGFLCPDTPPNFYRYNFNGFRDALENSKLSYNPRWSFTVAYDELSVATAIDQLLKCDRLPTAILCVGDAFATYVIQLLLAHNISIPQDISIIGLDDLIIAPYLNPPLTTMTFDKELLGATSISILYKIINKEPYDILTLLPSTLVERKTVLKLQ